MIEYKGYIGHYLFDEKTNIFQGNVVNTHDLITFQGKSIFATRQAFQNAVDEYIEWHQKYSKKPDHILLQS
ncbi:MAG: hypothetical protein KBD36_02715 [Alphaproteobacteria bacterium]|jgi:predicted HicB family RNase H-like nuclease|nr:hypothetical protein [Alphaproteobacteria bacterium]MBP9776740.1 hypothetical protein [Alphaproteobacteria bacterium]